jgi:hypothetical protein
MNEKIRKLLRESRLDVYGLGKDYTKWDNTVEKFAELIVAECAEQSMVIGKYNTSNGVTPDLAIAIAVGLKKHFGVEE